MTSLAQLDPKVTMTLLSKESRPSPCPTASRLCDGRSSTPIWQLNHFLSSTECEAILEFLSSLPKEKMSFGQGRERLLVFGTGLLPGILAGRLKTTDLFLPRLNADLEENRSQPYGFAPIQAVWQPIAGNINPCLRLTTYSQGGSIPWHRDAQYTESECVRSHFTVVVFLNENPSSDDSDAHLGNLRFRIPTIKIEHRGQTVDEELKLIGTEARDVVVTPRQGSAIVFDQRLLHSSSSAFAGKTILRFDLLRHYQLPTDLPPTPSSSFRLKVVQLCRRLFRQAQYFELQNDPKANDLYERCLNLRQRTLEEPGFELDDLEDLLENLPIQYQLPGQSLTWLGRSGGQNTFSIDPNTTLSHWQLLRQATMCSLVLMTKSTVTIPPDVKQKLLSVVSMSAQPKTKKRSRQSSGPEQDSDSQSDSKTSTQHPSNPPKQHKPSPAEDKDKNDGSESEDSSSSSESTEKDEPETDDDRQSLCDSDWMNALESEEVESTDNLDGYFKRYHWMKPDYEWMTEDRDIDEGDNDAKTQRACGVRLTVRRTAFGRRCEGCSLCGSGCTFTESAFGQDEEMFVHDCKTTFQFDQYTFRMTNVNINDPPSVNPTTTGQIEIISPSQQFNHASCVCEKVFEEGPDSTRSKLFKFYFDFTIRQNNITLVHEPCVAV